MKRIILALLVALSATGATAQNFETSNTKKLVSLTERAEQKAKELKLDDANTAWFVPLYTEYQDTLRGVRRAIMDGSVRKAAKEMKKMDDATVKRVILKNFDIEEQSLALKRIYFEKFSEKLTAQQLLAVFQDRPESNSGQQRNQRQNNNNQQGSFVGTGGNFGGPGGGFGGPGF